MFPLCSFQALKALFLQGNPELCSTKPRKGHLWRISEMPLALQPKRQQDQFCYCHWKKFQHGTESPYQLFQMTSIVIWHLSSGTITHDQMFWLSLLPSQLCFPVTIVACMHLEEAQHSSLQKMQRNGSLVGCNTAVRLPEAWWVVPGPGLPFSLHSLNGMHSCTPDSTVGKALLSQHTHEGSFPEHHGEERCDISDWSEESSCERHRTETWPIQCVAINAWNEISQVHIQIRSLVIKAP